MKGRKPHPTPETMNDTNSESRTATRASPVLSATPGFDAVIASHHQQPPRLTAADLADLECPQDVRVSAFGKRAVYCLHPASQKGEYETASLWIADVGKEHSARQLTSGLFKDEMPQWSPDGTTIAFISDRAKHGQSSAIYLLPVESSEPFPITDQRNKKISSFKWSADGRFIAFTSPEEDTADEQSKAAQKDDAIVYGAKCDYNRLRCIHLEASSIPTLYDQTAHVTEFAWNANSNQLVYVLQETPRYLDPALDHGVSFGQVSLTCKTHKYLFTFPGPVSQLTWFGEYIYFLGGVLPNKGFSASMIYRAQQDGQGLAPFAFGADDCAKELRGATGFLAVQIQKGLKDQILLMFESSATVLYSDTYEIKTWDILDLGDGKEVLVIGRGSPSKPTEICICGSRQGLATAVTPRRCHCQTTYS